MATVTKTRSGKWQAIIRRTGWPQITKTFRIKRDAENWALGIEDEMLRGAYVQRTAAEKMTIADALRRYWEEIVPLKKPPAPNCANVPAFVRSANSLANTP